MQIAAVEKINADQFLGWVASQEERFELIEGEVVLMAGAGRRHDNIVVNLTAAVHSQVKGSPCQTFTGDTYVAISSTTRRMPDLGVDCGKPDDNSMVADKPTFLVEVLSPTTGGFDVTVKLAEYQSLPSMEYILLIDTEMPSTHLYFRSEDDQRWEDRIIRGLDAVLDLSKINVRLTLADIYAGLQFHRRPRLIEVTSPSEDAT